MAIIPLFLTICMNVLKNDVSISEKKWYYCSDLEDFFIY